MKKRRLTIFLLLALAGSVHAGVIDMCELFNQLGTRDACEACRVRQNAPEYYCDCHFGTRLNYGLDTIISDTTWLFAYVNDVSTNGINGYWFADSALVLDFYLACTQDRPVISRVLAGNYNLSISPDEFDAYLSKSGADLGSLAGNMKLYIRASVRNRSGEGSFSGRMIGLSIAQGLDATCETEYFPVMMNCKTVLNDNVENVYEWEYKKMSPYYRRRQPHVTFYREQSIGAARSDMELYITEDSCNGPIVAHTILHDSLHAYFMDTALMAQQYAKRKSLFLHAIPQPNITSANLAKGKMRISTLTHFEPITLIDTTICYGSWIQVSDTMLTESTIYIDTIALQGDSVYDRKQYNLTVRSTEPIDTTLYWKQADLNNTRFDGWKKFTSFGEQELFYHYYEDGACAVAYHVTIEHDWDTVYTTWNVKKCKGTVYTLQKQSYTSDTTVVVALTSNNYPDTVKIVTCNMHFTEPELEYDTIYVHSALMPYNYHGVSITEYGTQEVYVATNNPNECDRKIQLLCLRASNDIQIITETIDTTICKGKKLYLEDNTVVATSGIYEVTVAMDSVTILKYIYNVAFEQLPVEIDTVYTASLPIEYEGQTINKYGLTVVNITNDDECERKIKLYVIQQTYAYETVDTTLCVGQSITLMDSVYTTNATVVVEQSVAEHQILQITYNLLFTPLDAIQDTIALKENELPTYYNGHYITNFGNYELDVETENGCLQHVYLLVERMPETDIFTVALPQLELHPTFTNANETIYFIAPADGVLMVTDMLGRVVLTQQVFVGEHHFALPQQGNYIVKYQTSDSFQTGRVVVK